MRKNCVAVAVVSSALMGASIFPGYGGLGAPDAPPSLVLLQEDETSIGLGTVPDYATAYVLGVTDDNAPIKFINMATRAGSDGEAAGFYASGDFGGVYLAQTDSGYSGVLPNKSVVLMSTGDFTLGSTGAASWSYVFNGSALGSMSSSTQRFDWGTTQIGQTTFFTPHVKTLRGSAVTCNSTNAGTMYYRTVGTGGTQRSGLCLCGVGASGAYSYTVTHSLNSFVLADC